MAISRNLYTRGLKQRLAGAVWYNRKGETVVRELAAQVSNPKSAAQMEQRAKLANMVAFYRANQFWMHWGAFQTKKSEWSDYNAFVSANMGMDAVYLTKQWAEAGATVVAPYIVSVGSLPRVNVTVVGDTLISDIYVGSELTIVDNTPIGTISAAILANNNAIQEGDQISIVVEIQQSTSQAPYVTARAFELIVDTQDTTTVAERGLEGLTVEGSAGQESLGYTLPSENGGGTFILSREDSKGLRVSSQEIVLTATQETYLASFKTSAAKAAYMQSYGSDGSQNFLSGGYSSQASEGGVSLPQQILTVKGVAAGGYTGSIEGSITIVMASTALPLGTGGIKVGHRPINSEATVEYNTITSTNVTISGNTYVVDTDSMGGSNTHAVYSIEINTEDGEQYTANFTTTQPEISE